VIVDVDGTDVASPRELARLIGGMTPGTKTEITVWRNGESQKIAVELTEMPGVEKQAALQNDQQSEGDLLENFGLTVTAADSGEGVVVTAVEPGSAAADRGIRSGDVVVAVNSVPVDSAGAVEKAVAEASRAGRKAVLFQLQRDDTNRFVALPVARG
jgi:serine protease Do